MKYLYSLSNSLDSDTTGLYYRAEQEFVFGKSQLAKEECVDFATYFNSFSAAKWLRYTTLQELALAVQYKGAFSLELYGYTEAGRERINCYELVGGVAETKIRIDYETLQKYTIIGCQCKADQDGSILEGIDYYGTFTDWQDKKIAISICTFNREEYLRPNVEKLYPFVTENPWLSVFIINNGKPIDIEEQKGIQVFPNKNFGGSGGFTRGLIEVQSSPERYDYILFMDDDIRFDVTTLMRSRALVCTLKEEYKDSFVASSMIFFDNPTVQCENKSYWDGYRYVSLGKDLDLCLMNDLVKNDRVELHRNMYPAWWYCMIPIQRSLEIGLPLPIFIKGDDMEYGMRNEREVISLNGIGVWHEAFDKKMSPLINYFADRNMLMMNNYASGCNFITFVIAILGRYAKRLASGDLINVYMLKRAIQDYNTGLEGITSMPADEKLQAILAATKDTKRANGLVVISVLKDILTSLANYQEIRKGYLAFRETKLKDAAFWKTFLGID